MLAVCPAFFMEEDLMSALSLRIRKARAMAALSQLELARRVGVQRSAVIQWEHPAGTLPSVEHMIRIALETDVSFEWIATGRGPSRLGSDFEPTVIIGDYAMDAEENKALDYLRSMSTPNKRIALRILQSISQMNRPGDR